MDQGLNKLIDTNPQWKCLGLSMPKFSGSISLDEWTFFLSFNESKLGISLNIRDRTRALVLNFQKKGYLNYVPVGSGGPYRYTVSGAAVEWQRCILTLTLEDHYLLFIGPQ